VKLELWTCGTAGRPTRENQGRKIFTRRVAALVMVAHRTLCRSNEVSRSRGVDRGGASTARAGAAGRGGADRGRRERPGGGKAVPGVADVSEPLAAGAGGRAALASKGAGGARCKLTPAQPVQTPRHPPHQLSAATPPRVREQGHPPDAVILEPGKITVKAVCAHTPIANGQSVQVHVHAKKTLTMILLGFIWRRSEEWTKPDSPSSPFDSFVPVLARMR
jgi:hypothetical protein